MFIEDIDEEINIRMLAARDSESLFEITDRSREYLREWLPWVDEMKTVEDSSDFIKNGFQIYAEQTGLTVGVFYLGNLVGVAGYNSFNWKNKAATIGYWLDIKSQGLGIMTRVVRALTEFAHTELGLNRVEIRVAAGNKKSEAVPIRLGFTKEGTLRQAEWLYDHYVDNHVYSMLRSDEKTD